MTSAALQLLVLAAIAVFLILRLRSVLGTREGFEKPPLPREQAPEAKKPRFDVIEGGPDPDITAHVDEGTSDARALEAMKRADPSFNVGEFLTGARGAYEMILMAFEKGDIDSVAAFLDDDVEASFREVVEAREAQGLHIDATFAGISGVDLTGAEYDEASGRAEITVRFIGELYSVLRNANGDIVEGDPNALQRQRDVWSFGRDMNSADPNWQLVATGE